jgi:hypothetical protein
MTVMVKVFIAQVCCFIPFVLFAQGPLDKTHLNFDTTGKKDLIDVGRSLFNLNPRPVSTKKKKVYFSILPVSTAVPGGGTAIFTSTTAGFYLGDRSTTYLSSVTFTPYFNLKGRYGLPIRSNIWLNNNNWLIQGDTRLLVYPQLTWGLGGGQPQGDRLLVNYSYIRFYQAVLKKITSYFFAGIGYNLDYYIDIENNDNGNLSPSIANFTHYQFGTSPDKNSFSSGPSLVLLYDTRKNDLNPIPGVYANFIYRYNAEILGTTEPWQSIYADFRKYIALTNSGPKNMLAFWAFYWTVLGTAAPYLELPAIGMDPYNRSARGIEQNRFRGKKLADFESEYRRDITANGLLGFVLFGSVSSAAQLQSNRFEYWNPAGGAGLRIKFNKKSDTNICVDYGLSKDFSTLIVGLGEAF